MIMVESTAHCQGAIQCAALGLEREATRQVSNSVMFATPGLQVEAPNPSALQKSGQAAACTAGRPPLNALPCPLQVTATIQANPFTEHEVTVLDPTRQDAAQLRETWPGCLAASTQERVIRLTSVCLLILIWVAWSKD